MLCVTKIFHEHVVLLTKKGIIFVKTLKTRYGIDLYKYLSVINAKIPLLLTLNLNLFL